MSERWRQACAYVSALTGNPQSPVTWQLFADNDSGRPAIRHGSLRQLGRWLDQQNGAGCGVFVTVNETDLRGRKAHNVVRVRALFIDCDDVAPTSWHLPPSFVVQSVAGPHAYWLVDDCDLSAFNVAQRRLIQHYSSDPKIHDLPRVLRLPGFFHRKRDPVLITMDDDPPLTRYATAEVLDGIAELPPPPPRPKLTYSQKRARARWRKVDALAAFGSAGLLGRTLAAGKYAVLCPWNHEHSRPSRVATGSTVLWTDNRWGEATFHCSHAHCDGRRLSDALVQIGAIR